MDSARQQITKKECRREREGRQGDMSKTSPDSVDKAGCVVVCCDTMRVASCEALTMVNKILSSRLVDSIGCTRQAGGECGMEEGGVAMLWVGQQIAFQDDVWSEGYHGGVQIVCHEVSKRFERHS